MWDAMGPVLGLGDALGTAGAAMTIGAGGNLPGRESAATIPCAVACVWERCVIDTVDCYIGIQQQ